MEFSLIFYFHFILSFVGFLFLGVFLCRGSWRNFIRVPFTFAVALLVASHINLNKNMNVEIFYIAVFAALVARGLVGFRYKNFKPSVVREGHNFFGFLVGAALFALTVQLHAVLFSVPVFQLVK
jgi:hypothetical protein